MKIHKGYKYRLKTNKKTIYQFVQFAGACRFVWNKVLAINEARYLAGVPRLTSHEAAWLLTLWKQSEEYGFLATVHSQILQQCLIDLDRAYYNLYAGRAKPPTYRKKFLADAFRYPQGFRLDGPQVYLPKIGWVHFWKSRTIDGTIKSVTVSRSGKHWYVALRVEMDLPDPVHPSTACVGLDLGIATFAALVAAKSGLNKAILDQGWGMFRTMLEYKQAWRGGTVLAVFPRYTSQRCAACGYVDAANRVQQALFSCKVCGHSYHADINAARNILAAGQTDRLNAYSPL